MKTQFPTVSVLLIILAMVLQGCASLLSQSPDDMDGDQTPYSQSAPTSDHPADSENFQDRVSEAIQSRDIVLGMSSQDVLASWGQPRQIQVAGNATNGNERWIYSSANGSIYGMGEDKIIYFERGRVAGWETAQDPAK